MHNFKATLGGEAAYSLDYNAQVPCSNGEMLSEQNRLNEIATAAMLFEYPTVSPKDMGVENEEEAIMATQFAVWRLAQAKGIAVSKSLDYIFDMDNLMANEGCEESLERIKAAAQGIVAVALEEMYYANQILNVDHENSNIRLQEKQMLVGPYVIKATGYNVTDVQVSFINAPESAVLCDKDGNVKDNFENGEDIYIRLDSNVGEITFTLRFDTIGSHYAGVVYGTGVVDDNKQNFCMIKTFEDELDATVDITLPKIPIGAILFF